jgi:beta-galactosidase
MAGRIGLYENGVTAYGVDLTSGVNFGDKDNVIAVRVDNTTTYHERATDVPFRWNANDFNPDFGGINRQGMAVCDGQGLSDAAGV